MRLPFAVTVFALGLAGCGPEREDETAQSRLELTGQWQTGAAIGNGVAVMDTGNVLGENIFIGYAGWNVNQAQAQGWVGALYDARLRDLGVRTIYAVQGPADSLYNGQEIGNSKIAAVLKQKVNAATGFVIIAGHSSGSFVADELLQQLESGADPANAVGSRTVYFDLDGDQKTVSANGINRLRKAYYVNARNPVTGSNSYNHSVMITLGAAFAAKGGTFEYNASSSACTGTFCTHISLINTVPHNPGNGSGIDYADFAGRPVNRWWLDVKLAEAGLGQCTTAVTTQGAIELAYVQLGGCGSFLGSPTTNELATPDGVGRFNHFQSGSIYWTLLTGAHEVHGPIHSHWALLGWERGALGYPVANEQPTVPREGRYSRFQRGAIYFSLLTGAHAVTGSIYAAWAALSFENGRLGFPISDPHLVAGLQQSDFEHGSIIANADGGTQLVFPTADGGILVDAGAGTDAGTETDGGLEPLERDAGTTVPPDAGARLEQLAGGCSAAGSDGGALISLLVTFQLSAMRRRCRSARCARRPGSSPAAGELSVGRAAPTAH